MKPDWPKLRVIKKSLVALSLIISGTCCAQAGPKQQVVREDIEWSRAWVPGVNHTDKPHILLIGDSITEGYSGLVEKQLGDLAYVAKLTTSKSLGDPLFLEEVALVLRNAHFEVIHFNNGMHGAGYTERDYREDFPKLLKLFKTGASGAQLICATTTPKRMANHLEQFDAFNERIRTRNEIARGFAQKNNIRVDDLFGLVENHPEFYRDDGTHFAENGAKAEGLQVAEMIKAALKK